LVLNPDSEPQPDLALLRPRDDFYRGAHPTSSDVLLAVEVADTSLRFDREIEIPLYARHGLPEAWLVGVKNKCLTVFRAPMDDDYREVQEFRSPGFISFYALPKVRVDLHGLF
jgi:Uma2 family endonuclease